MIRVVHYGPEGASGSAHKGAREDCPHPECAWPRMGDWVSARSHGVERTGELVDFHLIRTSSGDEYGILRSTIRKPDRGSFYCPHGLKILEEVPDEVKSEDSQVGRMVEPWPCTSPGCTRERFEEVVEAEIEEHWEGVSDLMRTQYE